MFSAAGKNGERDGECGDRGEGKGLRPGGNVRLKGEPKRSSVEAGLYRGGERARGTGPTQFSEEVESNESSRFKASSRSRGGNGTPRGAPAIISTGESKSVSALLRSESLLDCLGDSRLDAGKASVLARFNGAGRFPGLNLVVRGVVRSSLTNVHMSKTSRNHS